MIDDSNSDEGLKQEWKTIAERFGERRSPQRLIEHYRLEHRLAGELSAAGVDDRRELYSSVYRTLFEEISDHSQLTGHNDHRATDVAKEIRLLRRFLPPAADFVEIGAGDGLVTAGIAPFCRTAVALDVTDLPHDTATTMPSNMRYVCFDGFAVPLGDSTVDLAYSNQLLEHLHPDDAARQIREIFRILRPGGAYLCVTPNALFGPHDISRYFTYEASGFHLKEYTYRSLADLFIDCGGEDIALIFGHGRLHVTMPLFFGLALETVIGSLPRRLISGRRSRIVSQALGIRALIRKPKV